MPFRSLCCLLQDIPELVDQAWFWHLGEVPHYIYVCVVSTYFGANIGSLQNMYRIKQNQEDIWPMFSRGVIPFGGFSNPCVTLYYIPFLILGSWFSVNPPVYFTTTKTKSYMALGNQLLQGHTVLYKSSISITVTPYNFPQSCLSAHRSHSPLARLWFTALLSNPWVWELSTHKVTIPSLISCSSKVSRKRPP